MNSGNSRFGRWFGQHPSPRKKGAAKAEKEARPKPIKRTHFLTMDTPAGLDPKKATSKNDPIYFEIVELLNDFLNVEGLEYDLEWLAILKATDEYVSTQEFPELKQIEKKVHVFI